MGCGASSAPEQGSGNVKDRIMEKAKDGAKMVTEKVTKLAGNVKASVTSKYIKFRSPEEDPLVPELLAKSIQRFRAAFVHSEADEIRDAMKNAVNNVAATETKQGEIASSCMLELIWAARTLLGRLDAGTLPEGKKINWLQITETETAETETAAAAAAEAEAAANSKKPRKGARRLIAALRAVLKDGNATSMLDCSTFAYEHFIYKDDEHARRQMQQHPNIEGLAFAARAFGRRMLEGQFACPPSLDALELDETRVMERYLKQGRRPQPLTWEEVTAVTATYKALAPKLVARVGDADVVQELAAFKAHDVVEFPDEGEMRVIAALATLCGQKDVTEWGVKALVACLQRPETDPATKAMWKKLKIFTNLDAGAGEGKYLPTRLTALCENPPSREVCEDARNIASGVTAEDAAGVLRLRNFLWAFLGREHLKAFDAHRGDEEVLAQRRFLAGMSRPQPTSEEELRRFEKIFEALAGNARARLAGKGVRESAQRVSEMRRGSNEEVERVVLAALIAVGDDEVYARLPPRDPPRLGVDTRRYTFTEHRRRDLWQLCVEKLDDASLGARISALGSRPLAEVDAHQLDAARDLLVDAVDPADESMVNGEPFVLALLTSTWTAVCQLYLAGFRDEYSENVIAMELEFVVADLDSQDAAEAAAAECADVEEAEVTIAPLQTVASMAARRFVSDDFRRSCRQMCTLENPPPGVLCVLAATFVLLDEHKVTDHLPPLAMLAAGASNRKGRKPAQPKVSLAAFFRQVDTDGSGALDAEELNRALRAIGLGAEEAEASMAALDADGDGKVTLFEFEAGLKASTVKRIESQLNAEGKLDSFRPLVDVARVFVQFDADGDGTLSPAELGSVLASLGIKGVDLNDAMAGFDEDEDGEISLEEWKTNLSDRTKAMMAKKLDERGLIAGYVPPAEAESTAETKTAAEGEEEAAAAPPKDLAPPAGASEEPEAPPPAGPGPVVESVGKARAAGDGGGGGGDAKEDPMGSLACLTAGERGALWDAVRLAVNMDDNSGADFFPAKLAAVASGPALDVVRCAAALALVAGIAASELDASSGLGAGLLHHVRCVVSMNPLKIAISPADNAAADAKACAQVMKDYLSLGIKAQPKTAGEAARLLPVFEELVISTAAVFFETDVLRGLLDARVTTKELSAPAVRLLAALVVLAGGSQDIVDMLEAAPGLIECEGKEDKAKVWRAVNAAIELEPARPSFLPKELETCAANVAAGISLPPDRLALVEALAAGVQPAVNAKERRVAVRCAYLHVWSVIGLHSVRAFTAAA